MLKRLITLLVFFACFTSSHANEEVSNLLLMEAHAYQLTADISILALQEGGDRFQRRLDQTIDEGGLVASSLKSRWPAVDERWHHSTRFANEHRLVAAQNSDVNFANGLEAVQGLLYSAIDSAKAELAVEDITSESYAVYEALIALEKMVAEYMFFNVNVFGGFGVMSSEMEANALLFRDALERISDNGQVKKQVLRKWNFIEKTLLNYNNQSATFIVMKTTDKIREMLPVG